MRKMFSKKQLEELIAIVVENSPAEVVKALKGQDINVEGITSKGIANTGGFGNIGNVAISGELSVIGDTKVFENIVDKDGHKRFIEGDITFNEITGITKRYAKWSLSGSHLLIVAVGKVDINTALSNVNLSSIDLPIWIFNKLVSVIASSTLITKKNIEAYNTAGHAVTWEFQLRKDHDNNRLRLNIGNLTAQTSEVYFRATFDLLIDNE